METLQSYLENRIPKNIKRIKLMKIRIIQRDIQKTKQVKKICLIAKFARNEFLLK